MIYVIENIGPSYNPLSYISLCAKDVVDEVRRVDCESLDIETSGKDMDVVSCDDRSDVRYGPNINLMVTSIYGSMYLRAIDTSGE
ncbi:hypothetical protein L7F22_058943, partial [Adiantum nelumboides]|nr:hypothetical protein [Adiantum nelumboides]